MAAPVPFLFYLGKDLALRHAAILRHSECEETPQDSLLLVRQFERKDQGILVRILDATLIIKIHDFFKVFEATVMHIGGASGDLSQGRGFKGAEFFGILGHHVTAKIYFVVVPADAEVVKLFVGEVEPGMALCAASLIPEQEEARCAACEMAPASPP